MDFEGGKFVVIQPGPHQLFVLQRKTQRLDQM